jgi:hypothetical protein
MSEAQNPLENRVIILNGFSDSEIIGIMNVVKSIYANTDMEAFARFVQDVDGHPEANDFTRRLLRSVGAAKSVPEAQSTQTGDLIFAKTTESSVEMKLRDLIEDMSEDHAYLKANPPGQAGTQEDAGAGSGGQSGT